MKSSEKNKITTVLLIITLLAGVSIATIANTTEASAQEPGYIEEEEEEEAGRGITISPELWGGEGEPITIPLTALAFSIIAIILIVFALLYAREREEESEEEAGEGPNIPPR